MHSFTVHKTKEFLVYIPINEDEVSHSVTKEDFDNYKIKDKVVVKFVQLGFPKKRVIANVLRD